MIIKNVSGKTLKYLDYWENPRFKDCNDYNIVATHEIRKTITRPLPIHTDAFMSDKKNSYLEGFVDCYTPWKTPLGYTWGGAFLKDEYRGKNRPKYTIEISYNLYDIELTEKGMKKVVNRCERYRRLAERYATLLPTND